MYKISNNNLKNKVENGLEKNDAENILTQEKGYTKRQKISLFLGAFLFIVLAFMPVPTSFIDFAISNAELSDDVVKAAIERGILTKEDNKIKALDVYEFLNWLKEKDVKAYDEIMSKAYKMKIVLALTVLMAIW